MSLRIVILGLSITSSWGNGHATTWRGLVRELERRRHDVTFLERDRPWYADNRDLPKPPYGRTFLYQSLPELFDRFSDRVRRADVAIVGSFVPDGVQVGRWVTQTARGTTAFYDIDTPVTLEKLHAGDFEYIDPGLVRRYDIYLSFTGGPLLRRLERDFGASRAAPLFCSVDPELHRPVNGAASGMAAAAEWGLGYLGTYSADRRAALDELLLKPARMLPAERFVVAGPQYPDMSWPANVRRIDHVPPQKHSAFYCTQRYTLNVTRAQMARVGWSPSVRLFEAAACGVPIISDIWPGLDAFFLPGREILTARSAAEVVTILRDYPETERRAMADRARKRVLSEHTAARRAEELESFLLSPPAATAIAVPS
jgi:spore maturation protein CgeB